MRIVVDFKLLARLLAEAEGISAAQKSEKRRAIDTLRGERQKRTGVHMNGVDRHVHFDTDIGKGAGLTV